MEIDALVERWLTLPDVAEQIDMPLPKVRQLVREGKLVKGLAGALTVLRDAGYSNIEALRWLLTEDDALPGRPVDAMAAGRDTAVKRRAQVLAF